MSGDLFFFNKKYRGKPLSDFQFEMFVRSEMFGPGEHWVVIDIRLIKDLRKIPDYIRIGLLRVKEKENPEAEYLTFGDVMASHE